MLNEEEPDRRAALGLLYLLLLLMRAAAIVLVLVRMIVVALVLFSIIGCADNFAPGRDYSKGFDYQLFSRTGKIYPQGIWVEAEWTIRHGALTMLPFLGIAALVSYVKKRRVYFLTACLVAIASPLTIGTIVQIRGGNVGDAQKYSSSTWLFYFIVFTGWAWLELWMREQRLPSSARSGFQFSLEFIFLTALVFALFLMKL
jgi:hypothetical protein